MRNLLKLALVTVLFAALMVTPVMAKKKPIDRTVVDGVTLAEVKVGSQIEPYYPATARTTNQYAEVIVSLQVMETGKVGEVDVVQSSVEGLGFEESAADAVKAWRFHPALEGGQPIESATLVRLTFAPPTLKSPEGFVFAETSPRNYTVAFFNANNFDLTKGAPMGFGNTTANHSNRDVLLPLEQPPCPDGVKGDCLYDKSLLRQFGGGDSPYVHLPSVDISNDK